MKNKKTAFVILALFLGFGTLSAQQSGCLAIDMPKEDLSKTEKKSLLYMYEEEKLAGDVYKTLNQKWNLRIFTNISRAEDHHKSMVAALLDKYEIEYVKDLEMGQFSNEKLQELYDALIEKGNKSIEQALTVGATIEDLDIYDLEETLEKDNDNKDIAFVYDNLIRGSKNHMRAFTRWLTSYDINYKAQYITQEKLELIISK